MDTKLSFFVVFRGIFEESRTVVRTVCGQCCGPRCATRCSVLRATSGSGFLSEQTKQWKVDTVLS